MSICTFFDNLSKLPFLIAMCISVVLMISAMQFETPEPTEWDKKTAPMLINIIVVISLIASTIISTLIYLNLFRVKTLCPNQIDGMHLMLVFPFLIAYVGYIFNKVESFLWGSIIILGLPILLLFIIILLDYINILLVL